MKTTFQSKEEYLKVKENWSTYFNQEARNLERNEYGNKLKKLTATHFFLYAILRDRDPMKTLSENTSYETFSSIKYDINAAIICIERTQNRFWFEKWSEFFGITEEQTEKMIQLAKTVL